MKKWLDNYGKKENANEGHSSASKEWIGEGYSNVGRNYSPAWGGQFEEGGEIPQAQNGMPTRADSIVIMNNAIAKNNFYKNNPNYYKAKDTDNVNFKDPRVLQKLADAVLSRQDLFERKKYKDKSNNATFDNFGKSDKPNSKKPITYGDVRHRLGRVTGTRNIYSAPDIISENEIDTYFNPASPPLFFSPSILPQGAVKYESNKYGDVSYSPYYDPLAVTPWDMLKPKQQQERLKKYGVTGTPYADPNYKQQITQKPKPEPSLKKKVTKMEPIPSKGKSTTPQLKTIEQPNIELPDVERGQYRTSYYDPQMKDWNERAFMTQKESDQFADEMSKRGLPGSYGNVTQRVQYQKGGTLPPIYTDDLRKVKDYTDSLKLYKENFNQLRAEKLNFLPKFLKRIPFNSIKDNEYAQNMFERNDAWDTRSKGEVYPEKIKPIYFDIYQLGNFKDHLGSTKQYSAYYKKPVQPYIYQQKPTLNKQVTHIDPISTSSMTSAPGLRTMQQPNIQMSGAVPQGNWNVEYLDPDSKKTEVRHFITNEDAEKFYNDPANKASRKYSNASSVGRMQLGGNVYPVNYVPQAQDGLTFLEPTSPKLPSSYVIPYRTPSSELASSVGGENGEPAFLIPTFKYGHLLDDPDAEFRKTGEHLGGPFKTWQEADAWDREVRHPYVEKGQNIPTPLRRWGKDFAMGGKLSTAQTGNKLSAADEASFQKFFGTLPMNLRRDEPDYNIRGYWDALGRPSEFDYTQPKQDDGYYHAFSRNPETGEILKAPFHHTFKMAIDRGNPDYFPIVTPEGKIKTVTGRQYEPTEEVPVNAPLRQGLEFAMGGSIPGSVGFTYARTNSPAPSNGPYAKKTKASAQDGKEFPIDPTTNPTYAQPLDESLQYVNDWMNSPMYKQMLLNSLRGKKRDYENLDRRRKSVVEDGKINYYEESIDPRIGAESQYVGKGKSKMYFNKDADYPDWYNNILHELFHITDAGGLGIPLSDKKLMYKYATHDIKDSPFYESAKATGTLDDLKKFTNYVNAPSETRARINNLRKLMRDQEVYDPFTQPFSKDMFDKYKQLDINEEDKKAGHTIGPDPYQQLRMTYTDEEIEDMMNKISKADNNELTPIAQNGMTFYQHGLDWKPKTISKNGGWLDKYIPEAQNGLLNCPPGFTKNAFGQCVNASGQTPNQAGASRNIISQAAQPAVVNPHPLATPFKTRSQQVKENTDRANRENYRLGEYSNQASVGQGRTSTLDEERERIRKNNLYASQNSNAAMDAQGNLSTVNPNRTMEGKALPYTPAARFDKGMTNIAEGLEYAGYAEGLGELANLGYGALRNKLGQSMESGWLSKMRNTKSKLQSPTVGTDYIWNHVNNNIQGALPKGLTKQHIADVIEGNLSWIESPEYLSRRMATTGETAEQVTKDVQALKNRFKNTKIKFTDKELTEGTQGTYRANPSNIFAKLNKDIIVIDPNQTLEEIIGTIDHEVGHALSPALKNEKLYKNYPFLPTEEGDAIRESLKQKPQSFINKIVKGDRSKDYVYLEDPTEQQVRYNRLNAKIREDLNLPRNEGTLTDEQFDQWSDTQRKDKFKSFVDSGYEDVGDLLGSRSNTIDRSKILENLNKAWGIVPAVVGAAALQKQKKGGVIKDDRGQWAHPGEITEIGSNRITMQGVPYPVLGISDENDVQMMFPGEEYKFKGKKVTEFPMAQNGYTTDPNDYRRWQDSVKNYNESMTHLATSRKKVKKNIDDFSVLSKEGVASAIGNLFNSDVRKIRPKYSESDLPRNYYYNETSTEEQPTRVIALGDQTFYGGYVMPGTKSNMYDKLNINKDNWYNSHEFSDIYSDMVKIYPPPVRKNLQLVNPQKKVEKPKPPEPTLKRKPVKMETIKSKSSTTTPGIKTMSGTPVKEQPVPKRGEYRVSYYNPDIKDWSEKAFETEKESDKFADEMTKRGYGGSYGNVTQTRKVNKKENGGWLSQYK